MRFATKLFVGSEPIDYLCVVFSPPLIILSSKKEAAMTDNTTAQSSHYEDETFRLKTKMLGRLVQTYSATNSATYLYL